MADLIIVNGDLVTFPASVGAATVGPLPATISGSAATTTVGGKAACLEGDEKQVQALNCPYAAGAFAGGFGTLKIDKLGSDQLTETTKIEGKKVVLKGSQFDVVFEVTIPAPATSGTGPPDSTPKYSGGERNVRCF